MNSSPDGNIDLAGVERREVPTVGGTSFKTIIIAGAIAAAVFALDLIAPLGVAGGVPYVVLVLFGWWFKKRSAFFSLAVIASILTLLGYFLSPEGAVGWVVFTNRAYAISIIWATAIALWWVWQERAYPRHQSIEEPWHGQKTNLFMDREGIFVFVLVIIIVATLWGVTSRIEDGVKTDLGKSLRTALETSQIAVRNQLEGQKKAAIVWSGNARIQMAVMELSGLPRDAETLINSRAQGILREWLTPVFRTVGYRGFFVIGKDNINLASSRNGNIGVVSLLTRQEGFLDRIWGGETLISLPQPSDVPLEDVSGEMIENLATMFVATPIRSTGGDVTAILTFRLEPDESFTPIFERGRFGDSGETYAFDRNGLLISESRFNDHLRQIGLITGRHSDLNVEIRDPGVNMLLGEKPALPRNKQPLTRMARSATAGNSGSDLDGYRDYRGVTVIGAWLWDDELGFGITTEVDVDEAFTTLNNMLIVVYIFALLSVGVLIVLAVAGSQARRKIARGFERNQLILSSAGEGIYGLDNEGRTTFVNRAAAQMVGWKPEELIGKPQHDILHHTKPDGSPYPREDCPIYAAFRENTVKSVSDELFWRKDGSSFPVEYTATPIKEGNRTTGAVVVFRDITERKEAEQEIRERTETRSALNHILRVSLDKTPLAEKLEESLGVILSVSWFAALPRIGAFLTEGPGELRLAAQINLEPQISEKCSQVAFGKCLCGRAAESGEIQYAMNVDERHETGFDGMPDHGHYTVPIIFRGSVLGVIVVYLSPGHPRDEKEIAFLTNIANLFAGMIDKHRAEEALQEAHDTLESRVEGRTAELSRVRGDLVRLTASANAPIFGVDPRGRIIEWNSFAARITGYDKDEVMNCGFVDEFVREDKKPFVRDVLKAAAEGRAAETFELTLIKRNGREVHILFNATPLTDAKGKVVSVICIGQDITESRKNEQALARQERNLRLIFSTVSEGIFGVDTDGDCLFANPACLAMLGYQDESELLGQCIHDLTHHTKIDGSPYPRPECPIGLAMRTENSEGAESDSEIFWRTDGTSFPVEYKSRLMIEDGKVTGSVVSFTDITARQHEQEKLIQSSKLATLGEMATAVAHELNQPLNVISMAAGGLLRKMDKGKLEPGQITEKLERITAQTRRAAGIIDHMRIFGRKSTGQAGPVDVKECVLGAFDLIGEQLRLSEIAVELDLPERCRPVLGFAVQLEQVLLNLISNARDALLGQDGDSARRIVVRMEDSGAENIQISILDNGGGVPGELLDRIFEPFVTTKESGKGTGLGLSVGYGIIRDMGGALTVENIGEGACFSISLPALEPGSEDSRPLALEEKPS